MSPAGRADGHGAPAGRGNGPHRRRVPPRTAGARARPSGRWPSPAAERRRRPGARPPGGHPNSRAPRPAPRTGARPPSRASRRGPRCPPRSGCAPQLREQVEVAPDVGRLLLRVVPVRERGVLQDRALVLVDVPPLAFLDVVEVESVGLRDDLADLARLQREEDVLDLRIELVLDHPPEVPAARRVRALALLADDGREVRARGGDLRADRRHAIPGACPLVDEQDHVPPVAGPYGADVLVGGVLALEDGVSERPFERRPRDPPDVTALGG